MKQRIPVLLTAAALCLGLVLPCTPTASAAFTDIPDADVAQAVAVLSGMGIVSGYADGGYHPGDSLTRAQFCKLAVELENHGDQALAGAYRSQFSDLPASHWAAGYVDLAYTEGLVSGYGDGDFGPDDPVTCAQAVTILLHILGWSNGDIGPFWPEDYMAKAAKLGLTDGVDAQPGDELTRGQAALLLRNLLDLDTAEGKDFLTTWCASTVENALLLDLDAESTDGKLHTAQVYANGAVTYYEQATALDEGFALAARGTLLLDKDGRVTGFVPGDGTYRSLTLAKVEADGLTDGAGNTYDVDAATPVLILDDDTKTTYGEAWYDMDGASAAQVYYTESGAVDLVIFPQAETYSGTLLTGYYEDASPNVSAPTAITILGAKLDVTDAGKASLKAFAVGDKITVELDGAGKVRAAYDAAEKRAELVGVLTSYANDSAEVELTSGITVSGKCTSASASGLVGGMVKVTASGAGKLAVSGLSGGAATGKWDVAAGTLGKLTVAGNVKVYDQVNKTAATVVDAGDILQESVPASAITYVGTNSAGQVDLIVLNDVTGDCYTYGFLKAGTKSGGTGDMAYTNRTVAVENADGTTAAYLTGTQVKNGAPGGVAGNSDGKAAGIVGLTAVEGVARSDFTGGDAVRAGDWLLTISGEVQVYNDATETWTTLEAAKSFTDQFTVYYDRTPETGGKVRLIVAE